MRSGARRAGRVVVAWLLVALLVLLVPAATSGVLSPGAALAPTPPMGWNSWNQVGCSGLDEKVVKAAADGLVVSGLARSGYRYVVVDDCWQGPRDTAGTLTADASRFPSGIPALAAYVHARGLKFGLYAVPGSQTCANYYAQYPVRGIGSLGHETQDAATFARWGVDFLKYDWCRADLTDGLRERPAFAKMGDALRATGRKIVYSISEYGVQKPWLWAPGLANLWRTSHDIHPTWKSIADRIDAQAPLAHYSRPGAWNDPDMLEIGNAGLTEAETKTHFGMWCMLSAPLILGTDIGALPRSTVGVLRNAGVLALDQDRLGRQAFRVSRAGGHEVWAKSLVHGDLAIALLNTTADAATIRTTVSAVGLPPGRWLVRDLWSGAETSNGSGRLAAVVPAHGLVLLRLSPISP
ncbi:glycoside hydrolase family 27 protein [Lacisediminihabitans profunda]|nr:glycoside hydrolase family 27 protein [Lacisediminihabitans profunda]